MDCCEKTEEKHAKRKDARGREREERRERGRRRSSRVSCKKIKLVNFL